MSVTNQFDGEFARECRAAKQLSQWAQNLAWTIMRAGGMVEPQLLDAVEETGQEIAAFFARQLELWFRNVTQADRDRLALLSMQLERAGKTLWVQRMAQLNDRTHHEISTDEQERLYLRQLLTEGTCGADPVIDAITLDALDPAEPITVVLSSNSAGTGNVATCYQYEPLMAWMNASFKSGGGYRLPYGQELDSRGMANLSRYRVVTLSHQGANRYTALPATSDTPLWSFRRLGGAR